MRIIETKVYQINEHPNQEKCFEWIRNNWHDLNEHSTTKIVESIKVLSEKIGGTFDYSFGQNPNRGEFIKFEDFDQEILCRLSSDDLPLTGVCWDADLIVGVRTGNHSKVLEALHSDTEYNYSDEGLKELCESNEYEFDESGKFYL